MWNQEILNEYSKVMQLIKSYYNQISEGTFNCRTLDQLKQNILTFLKLLPTQFDSVYNNIDGFDALLLDVNSRIVNSSINRSQRRMIRKSISDFNKMGTKLPEFKDVLIQEFNNIVVNPLDRESFIKNTLPRFDFDIKWVNPSNGCYGNAKEELISRIKSSICIDNEKIISNAIFRFFNKLKENKAIRKKIEEVLIDLNYPFDEKIIDEIIDYISKQYYTRNKIYGVAMKNVLDSISEFDKDNQEAFINTFLDNLFENIKELLSDNNMNSTIYAFITSIISKHITQEVYGQIHNLDISENNLDEIKRIAFEIYRKYLPEDEARKIVEKSFTKLNMDIFLRCQTNLLQAMKDLEDYASIYVSENIDHIVMVGNPNDLYLLENYAKRLKEYDGNDNLNKPIVLQVKELVRLFGYYRRAYLNYKSAVYQMLSWTNNELNKDEIDNEISKTIDQFNNEKKDIFNLSDMIHFIQTICYRNFVFMGNNVRDAQRYDETIIRDSNDEYIRKRILSVDLTKSNNPDVRALLENYVKCKKNVSEYYSHGGISMRMHMYIVKIRDLELCYQFLPLLENIFEQLIIQLEASAFDTYITVKDLKTIRKNAEELQELIAKFNYFVDIDLDKNNPNLEIIAKICEITEQCIKIIDQNSDEIDPNELPFTPLCSAIKSIYEIIYTLSKYYFELPPNIYNVDGLRGIGDAPFFRDKYLRYCTQDDFTNTDERDDEYNRQFDFDDFPDEILANEDDDDDDFQDDDKKPEEDCLGKYSDDPEDYGLRLH